MIVLLKLNKECTLMVLHVCDLVIYSRRGFSPVEFSLNKTTAQTLKGDFTKAHLKVCQN